MKEEVRIPSVGESIVEGMLMAWYKADGDFVRQDEDLYEFETEKANVVVPSPFTGALEIIVAEGTKVTIDQVVARIDTSASAPAEALTTEAKPPVPEKRETPAAPATPQATRAEETSVLLSPAVRRVVAEQGIDPSRIAGTGKGGRITKEDALRAAEAGQHTSPSAVPAGETAAAAGAGDGETRVTRAPLTPIRKSIAQHLLSARHEAAHLTTFNEINMERVQEIRRAQQPRFEKKYGTRLGIMSFFVKASVAALKEFPVVNARIEGDDIVYYNFYDIGVAVSTDRGLLVPVLRNADAMTFAEIEKKIAYLAERAMQKKILLTELQGGTFSITNGGIFGSLMSTPIPNYPQSAILGMHAIKDRPVAIQGEVRIKPVMYVALTYDHRLIDGKDAVSFLARIKEYIEEPEAMLLGE